MVNKLQIVRVDSVTVRKVDLIIGYNVIGRGAATGHVDNQIVEQAVTIHLAPNGEMTMTPMLACYMKSHGSNRWQSLKLNRGVTVRVGDIFSLFPEKSWFKITSGDCNAMSEENDINGKRKAANPTDEEPPDKKSRSANSVETIYSQTQNVLNDWDNEAAVPEAIDNSITNTTIDVSNDGCDVKTTRDTSETKENPSVELITADTDNTGNTTPSVPTEIATSTNDENTTTNACTDATIVDENSMGNRDEAGKKIKWDCGRHFSDQTDQQTNDAVDEPGEASTATQENPAASAGQSSTDKPLRDKCIYGSQCYRRNSDHRTRFSHPGDADYDVTDPRPECPYGVRCYRKNPQHKRDFKHTTNRRSRAQTPVRARAPDDDTGLGYSSPDDDSTYDSEYSYEPSHYGDTSDDRLTDFDDKSDCDDK